MTWSKLISIVLHPIFIPILIAFFILTSTSDSFFISKSNKTIVYLFLFLYTIVLPIIFTLILYKSGYLSSIEMKKNKERVIPIFITLICFIFCYLKLQNILIFCPILNTALKGIAIIVLSSGIISFFWKISLHMLGAGGLVSFLIFTQIYTEFFSIILFSICLSGLLGSARLSENAHSKNQIYSGFLLGFIIEFLVFYY